MSQFWTGRRPDKIRFPRRRFPTVKNRQKRSIGLIKGMIKNPLMVHLSNDQKNHRGGETILDFN